MSDNSTMNCFYSSCPLSWFRTECHASVKYYVSQKRSLKFLGIIEVWLQVIKQPNNAFNLSSNVCQCLSVGLSRGPRGQSFKSSFEPYHAVSDVFKISFLLLGLMGF